MDYFGANSSMPCEWSSLSGMCTAEEVDFMAQLLGGSCVFSSQTDESRVQSSLDEGFSFDSSELVPESDDNKENYYFDLNSGGSMPVELCIGDYMNKETTTTTTTTTDDKSYILAQNPRKRSLDHHVSDHTKSSMAMMQTEAKKRNVKAKVARKTQKDVSSTSNDEDGNVVSSSCFDDNNGELSSSLTLNSKGKVRASRGSATDPQSLYARKRRERINERLRILQNLVPNGTKVDISTMLEEAVEYVKFLQLQIKLLSSDDLWMYSPIAYNGMDLGLNITVPTSRA